MIMSSMKVGFRKAFDLDDHHHVWLALCEFAARHLQHFSSSTSFSMCVCCEIFIILIYTILSLKLVCILSKVKGQDFQGYGLQRKH